MEQGGDIIAMKEMGQPHVRVSENETSFANTDEYVQETEGDIDYEVGKNKSRSSIKPRKANNKPKNIRHIGAFVLAGVLFILIFLALSLGPTQEVSHQENPSSTKKVQAQADYDDYPLRENQLIIQPEKESIEPAPIKTDVALPEKIEAIPIKQQPVEPAKEEETTPSSPLDDSFTSPGPKQIKQVYIQIPNPQIQQNYHLHTALREHEDVKLSQTYPTMGIPEVGKQFNFTTVGYEQLYEYESIMDEVFRPYNDTNCELQRYGDYADGGYLLCKNFMNLSVALVNLGVEGRDYFGCQLTSAFNMANYQYDCTNGFRPNCPDNNGLNFFSPSCLGDRTEKTPNTQFFSLKDIVDSRNLTHKRVTMKIDVEGGEWPGFRTFPLEYLDYVDQFVLEIHNVGPGMQQGTFWGNDQIIKSLGQKFVSVNLHMNNNACIGQQMINTKNRKIPSFAIEVTMVNKRLITLHSNSRSYALHSKNHPNAQQFADCQMSA